MNAVPQPREGRGASLLAAHCASPDLAAHCASPDRGASSARDRLEQAVGAELAHKLVFALCAGHERHAA